MKHITEEVIFKHLQNATIDFYPTHLKLSLPIINRIYKKMMNGIKFDGIRVNDNLLIDGHHRFISSIIANKKIESSTYPKTSATVVFKWEEVKFVEEEWDTIDKIQYLNELDAEYNNIPIEKVIEIIK